MLKTSIFLAALGVLTIGASRSHAHCQIPCGIYGDSQRVHMMREDLRTIVKSAKLIRQLASKNDPQSKGQLVRWVVNKEQHAEKIIRTISDYFMAQKIKASAKGYREMLARHHAVMVAAMKCKQSVESKTTKTLGRAIDAIAGYWKK